MLYGWKKNLMLTNCLAACAHLTITISEIERDIGGKSSFSHTPLAFDAPVRGGSHWNCATPFGIEKLEWIGYPMVKKFRRYLYSFWRNSRTWQTDRRTDRHRMPAVAALMHSIAWQKRYQIPVKWFSAYVHMYCKWDLSRIKVPILWHRLSQS